MNIRLRRRGTHPFVPILATIGASAVLLASVHGAARAEENADKPSGFGSAVVGLDIEKAMFVASDRLLAGGSGFSGRVGYLLHLPFLRLTPEVGYGYLRFDRNLAKTDWSTYRFFVGA